MTSRLFDTFILVDYGVISNVTLHSTKGESPMNIATFAKTFNVTTDTIRFYEKAGLLLPQRQTNGYRLYTEIEQQDLKIILALKELDFSIKEIQYLLELKRQPISIECNTDSTRFITDKLEYIEQKIAFYTLAYQLLSKLRSTVAENNYEKNQVALFTFIDSLTNQTSQL